MKWLQRLKGAEHPNPIPEETRPAEPEQEAIADEPWRPGEVTRTDGEGIRVHVDTPDDAWQAIKELKLYKKEVAANRKEITQEIASVRAAHRTQVAGRYSTVGLGRGTTGRIMRAGIQGKRRAERMQTDQQVSALERQRNAYDRALIEIDRLVMRLDRWAAGGGEGEL
jgi:hypothetical protein